MGWGYTNFTACAAEYTPLTPALQEQWGWNGTVRLIPPNRFTQVSTQGCKVLCGNGTDYYEWSQASGTITTWVLPAVGVLLQAPFASNAFWETMFLMARWVGSPIVSLSYLFWNIKVSAKCAMMADMAGPYNKVDDSRDSDFASMRDSLYLLATMNQYSIASRVLEVNRSVRSKPAEGLLRLALFSKDLRLLKRERVDFELDHEQPIDPKVIFGQHPTALDHTSDESRLEPDGELNAMRQKLAQQLRESRRKGVVPVFISTLWFLFAVALSIQSSFGDVGQNGVAHDLALGLLVSWLPVLILCTIVDRNSVSNDDQRRRLNRLVDHVRSSIMDEAVCRDFVGTIYNNEERGRMLERIEDVSEHCKDLGGVPFFDKFSGQGRTRWHYGAAHPILCDIEDAYIAAEGRHWLNNETKARTYLVLGESSGGLDWLDYREIWQIIAALAVVAGTTFGAWTLSYHTPTVGLGCRSGGYTIFAVVAFGLLLFEMGLWWYWDAKKHELKAFQRRATVTFNAYSISAPRRAWNSVKDVTTKALRPLQAWSSHVLRRPLPQRTLSSLSAAMQPIRDNWEKLSPQQRWESLFFQPVEVVNTAWLVYRTLAQTFGTDNNCECMSSLWAAGGGYIDFTQWNTSNSKYVKRYWVAGTTIAVSVMGIAMAYIVLEWCLQSHLSTAESRNAAIGLQRVRRFRRMTWPVRRLIYYLDTLSLNVEKVMVRHLITWGVLSRTFEVRRIGLRWAKDPPASRRRSQTNSQLMDVLPSPVTNRQRSSSAVPLMRLPSGDAVSWTSVPAPAHFGATPERRSSDEPTGSPVDVRSHLLSPDINFRTPFARQASNYTPSEGSFDWHQEPHPPP